MEDRGQTGTTGMKSERCCHAPQHAWPQSSSRPFALPVRTNRASCTQSARCSCGDRGGAGALAGSDRVYSVHALERHWRMLEAKLRLA
jgi:hypothetical protein